MKKGHEDAGWKNKTTKREEAWSTKEKNLTGQRYLP